MIRFEFRGLQSPIERAELDRRNSIQFHFHYPDKDLRFIGSPPRTGGSMEVRIQVNDADHLGYVYPPGHRSWEPTNHHFWCQACAESLDPGVDPVFHALHDLRTGTELDREDVQLLTEMGQCPDLRGSVA